MTASSVASNAHPLLAAAASVFIPGLGQWIAGDRRKAKILLAIDAALVVTLLLFFRDRVSVVTAFFRPTTLALMMVGNIILLAYRVWAADDAYRTASDGGQSVGRTVGIAAAVVLGMVLIAPHLVFARYDLIQYDLLLSTFNGGETAGADTEPPSTSTPPAGTSSVDPTTVPPTTTTTLPPPWEELDRLNILLLGGDLGVGRSGIRTDTMITMSIDPKTGKAAMFQVPRNWTYAPLPEGMGVWDCGCYPELINELWLAGEQWPEAFPGPGSPSENAVKSVVSEVLGIPIH